MTSVFGWSTLSFLSVLTLGLNARAGAQTIDSGAIPSLDSLLNIRVTAASKYEQTTREAPASVVVITAADIAEVGYRTLAEALTSLTGFYSSYDRNYAYVGVRGFSRPTDYNNRLLVLLDGHELNDNFYNAALLGTGFGLSLAMVERIEVVRGPGSSLYGSSAMFAVVNVVTKSAQQISGLDVLGEVGTPGYRSAGVVFGHRLRSGLDVSASASWGDVAGADQYYQEFDDPSTSDGIASGLDWDRWIGGRVRIRSGDVALSAFASSRDKAVPTGAWWVQFNDPASHTIDRRWYLDAEWRRGLDENRSLTLRAFYDGYYYRGFYPYEAPGGLFADRNSSHWLGTEARFQWDPAPSVRLVTGAEYRRALEARYHSWDEMEVYFDGDYPTSQLSGFVQGEWQVAPQLALVMGSRIDRFSDAGTAISPRGAIVFHPADATTIKVLYGQAFRGPNKYERYYDDGTQQANLALEPERIRTWELNVEQQVGRQITVRGSLFDYAMRDLIDPTVNETDDTQQYRNVSRVRSRGGEVDVAVNWRDGLSTSVGYGFARARNPDLDEPLTNSPAHTLRVLSRARVFGGWSGAVDIRYDHERLTVQNTQLDGFWLVGASVSTPELKDLGRVRLTARNLLGAEYATPGGLEHVQAAIAQDGRQVSVQVELRLP
jgi:iron complex outermembrane receptor protein